MAAPTSTDLKTLRFVFRGLPFCSVAGQSGIDTNTLRFQYRGLPEVVPSEAAAAGFRRRAIVFINFG